MLVQPAWIAHLLCRPASKGDATGGWADWQVGKPGKRKGGRGEGVAGLATTFEWSCDFGDGTGIGWFDGRLRRVPPPESAIKPTNPCSVSEIATPLKRRRQPCNSFTTPTFPLPGFADLPIRPTPGSIPLRGRPAKQVRDPRWLNQHSLNRDLARIYGSVCNVRQSGMPKEPRPGPAVLGRVHQRFRRTAQRVGFFSQRKTGCPPPAPEPPSATLAPHTLNPPPAPPHGTSCTHNY